MELKTYRYRERTLKQKHADSLVLSDSLGRHIRYIFNTNTFFFPGCTINSLAHKIRTGEIDVTQYKYITLLIGTNDIGPKFIWKFYRKEIKRGNLGKNLPFHTTTPIPVITSAYQNLVHAIKDRNPSCILVSFAILPRPYDHHRNKQNHTDTNKALQNLCEKNNIIFVKTFNSFLKFGYPIEEYFCDGLHLSLKGNRQLNKLISNIVNGHRAYENRKNRCAKLREQTEHC